MKNIKDFFNKLIRKVNNQNGGLKPTLQGYLYILGIILVIVASVSVYSAVRSKHNEFVKGPDMNIARIQHYATLLPNGKVLITGGWTNVSSAEIYNSETEKFYSIGNMTIPRFQHTSTLLKEGKVLITGGMSQIIIKKTNQLLYKPKSTSNTAELFDPSTNKFIPISNMNFPRSGHSAILLNDDTVLIVGGHDSKSRKDILKAEIYNPTTNKFIVIGQTLTNHVNGTATLLPNGNVLIAGGANKPYNKRDTLAEIYNPETKSFAPAGKMNDMHTDGTATLLPNGNVLIAGGTDEYQRRVKVADIYDYAASEFNTATLNEARTYHTATLLPNGKVLVAGGSTNNMWAQKTISSAEIYDPKLNKFEKIKNLSFKRLLHSATLLNNGKVLITGGGSNGTILKNTELYSY